MDKTREELIVELQTQLRQLSTEVGEIMFRKRDVDLESKAINMQLEGFVKRRDEVAKQLRELAGPS